jgi:hypothetical protein
LATAGEEYTIAAVVAPDQSGEQTAPPVPQLAGKAYSLASCEPTGWWWVKVCRALYAPAVTTAVA